MANSLAAPSGLVDCSGSILPADTTSVRHYVYE
jgi:hypothetical protein